MSRRTPEQVHDRGGHKEFVASCGRCQTEAEQDRNAEEARAELAAGGGVLDGTEHLVGESGPELFVPAVDGTVVASDQVLGVVDEREAGPDEGPLPEVDPASYAEDSVLLPAERLVLVNGRPKCYLDPCPLPEFADGKGLCGAHYTLRPDLRKVARRA